MSKPAYSAFTTHYTGIASTLHVMVSVCDAGEPDTAKHVQTTAIWDTGAQKSTISLSLATELGILPSGNTSVKGVHGIQNKPTYTVDVILPNAVRFSGIIASECDDLSEDGQCRMLIGMDIISQGDMAVSNIKGETYFTFRVPSIERTDYVHDFKVEALKQAHFSKGKKNRR